jgi:hypothetical protein
LSFASAPKLYGMLNITCHSVAVQVAFERKGLKPVFHLIGFKG